MDDRVYRRTLILSGHLAAGNPTSIVSSAPCLAFTPPEASGTFDFNVHDMRLLLDGHHVEERDRVFALMKDCHLFNPRKLGSRVFVSPDYNRPMEEQREITMRRIMFLLQKGVFDGWLTRSGPENALKNLAALECLSIFDHSLAIKLGVHFFLWGCAIKYLGTKRHHNKWLEDTEKYKAKGCFSMTELGHGSNVRGIETIATYDLGTSEFIINTPCESAQKYWIGGAANHATHTVVFAQLCINGRNEGVHAFIAQIRDSNGNICPNIRIADCGHKIGLNGVDNGRIWFDNVRVPRENLLNSVADVSPDGQYQSAIKDPVQRFSAFLAPLTLGRVNISASAICQSKVALAIAIRYSLSRRAFSISSNEPETLLLDYPSHQRRLLPILAKTYAMSFASTDLKKIYVNRTAKDTKTIHVYSSAFKSIFTWHNMRTLQECREACGGQGLKTDNRIGQLIGEYDVQSTFEGDNNVLLQQVSKALLAEYFTAKKKELPFKSLGLEHMNGPPLVIPETLSPSILRSSQFQTELFCLHARDLLIKFAEEISKSMARGKSLEHALILSHQLAQDLAWAFSERAILQSFLRAEMTAASHLKNVLGLVRTMYALISMEENASFLRYGHLSVTNAAIVREEVAKLLTELRPHALALVTSFGIPDAYLSPLAFDWIEANSWTSVLAGHQV